MNLYQPRHGLFLASNARLGRFWAMSVWAVVNEPNWWWMDLVIHIHSVCPLICGSWPTSYANLSPLSLSQLMANGFGPSHSCTTLVQLKSWRMDLVHHICAQFWSSPTCGEWDLFQLIRALWSSPTCGEWHMVRFIRALVQVLDLSIADDLDATRSHLDRRKGILFLLIRRYARAECKVRLKP